MARAIVHVCQACGGNLRLLRGGPRGADCWQCDSCAELWTYGAAGWVRMGEEVSSGTRSTRRGSR